MGRLARRQEGVQQEQVGPEAQAGREGRPQAHHWPGRHQGQPAAGHAGGAGGGGGWGGGGSRLLVLLARQPGAGDAHGDSRLLEMQVGWAHRGAGAAAGVAAGCWWGSSREGCGAQLAAAIHGGWRARALKRAALRARPQADGVLKSYALATSGLVPVYALAVDPLGARTSAAGGQLEAFAHPFTAGASVLVHGSSQGQVMVGGCGAGLWVDVVQSGVARMAVRVGSCCLLSCGSLLVGCMLCLAPHACLGGAVGGGVAGAGGHWQGGAARAHARQHAGQHAHHRDWHAPGGCGRGRGGGGALCWAGGVARHASGGRGWAGERVVCLPAWCIQPRQYSSTMPCSQSDSRAFLLAPSHAQRKQCKALLHALPATLPNTVGVLTPLLSTHLHAPPAALPDAAGVLVGSGRRRGGARVAAVQPGGLGAGGRAHPGGPGTPGPRAHRWVGGGRGASGGHQSKEGTVLWLPSSLQSGAKLPRHLLPHPPVQAP
jgi:hypothetical protein